MANADVFKKLVDAANTLNNKNFFTGGNAALIGQHLLETAGDNPRDVMLIAEVGPILRGLLHPQMQVPTAVSFSFDGSTASLQ